MHGYKRLFLLTVIMACVSVVVAAIAVGSLYFAALGEQRARLTDTARSQARLMESIARFSQQHLHEFSGGAEAATLQQIEDAHRQYTGFGETGGFAVARRQGDNIQFLHSHRAGLEPPHSVPFDSHLAEPMRRALRGERGSIVGLDYQGTEVLAAYEPVADLDVGIVAKIDLAEVRAPFVRAALVAAGAGFLVVVLGAVCFVGLTNPMVRRLQQSERATRTLAAIVESSSDAIVGKDLDGTIQSWNDAAEQVYDYSRDEAIGKPITMLVPPDRQDETARIFEQIRRGDWVRSFETVRLRKNRQPIHVSLAASPIKDHAGQVIGAATIARDITEKKAAEEALRREHEFSESLTNTARNIVLVLDTNGRIIRFNPYMEELTGWRLDEVKGRGWFETFLPEHNREQIHGLFGAAISGQRTHGHVNTILTKDGHEREIEWYDAPLTSGEGELTGLLCTGLDVTERRMLEREILEIAAEEQRRIGQELHDNTQQQLTGLGLVAQNVEMALAKLSGNSAEARVLRDAGLLDRIEELHGRTQQVRAGLEQAGREANRLSRGLVPVEVDAQGLKSSLTELAGSVSEVQDVECTFVSDRAVEVPDNFTATHLYRIAQEAVNNALKHSRGNRIELSLSKLDNLVTLKVLDNGSGIDEKRTEGPGMGLRIMTYRADLIGASLNIGPANGGGTEVACTVNQS